MTEAVNSVETLKQREELWSDFKFIAGSGVLGPLTLGPDWSVSAQHCALIGLKHM